MHNFDLVNKLIEKELTISFAESITGGLLAKLITDCAGSSKILKESYITYSNESKIKILGVSEETVKEYGVVSKEISLEMAKGLKIITNSDINVSVTGNAGPTVCDDKPVGRAYYTIIFDNNEYTKEIDIDTKTVKDNIRDFIRNKVADLIIDELLNIIK